MSSQNLEIAASLPQKLVSRRSLMMARRAISARPATLMISNTNPSMGEALDVLTSYRRQKRLIPTNFDVCAPFWIRTAVGDRFDCLREARKWDKNRLGCLFLELLTLLLGNFYVGLLHQDNQGPCENLVEGKAETGDNDDITNRLMVRIKQKSEASGC